MTNEELARLGREVADLVRAARAVVRTSSGAGLHETADAVDKLNSKLQSFEQIPTIAKNLLYRDGKELCEIIEILSGSATDAGSVHVLTLLLPANPETRAVEPGQRHEWKIDLSQTEMVPTEITFEGLVAGVQNGDGEKSAVRLILVADVPILFNTRR
jgi:hypothetical protein